MMVLSSAYDWIFIVLFLFVVCRLIDWSLFIMFIRGIVLTTNSNMMIWAALHDPSLYIYFYFILFIYFLWGGPLLTITWL